MAVPTAYNKTLTQKPRSKKHAVKEDGLIQGVWQMVNTAAPLHVQETHFKKDMFGAKGSCLVCTVVIYLCLRKPRQRLRGNNTAEREKT